MRWLAAIVVCSACWTSAAPPARAPDPEPVAARVEKKVAPTVIPLGITFILETHIDSMSYPALDLLVPRYHETDDEVRFRIEVYGGPYADARAREVRFYLVAKGWSAERVDSAGCASLKARVVLVVFRGDTPRCQLPR